MCGIVAIFSRRKPISEGALQRATASLHHRGPDGQRHWISAGPAGRAWPCAAQHHRSRNREISRSPARTSGPASSSTASSTATRRIQRELERAGHRLRTRSDSEIALHLYEDLGAAVPAPVCAASSPSCSGTRRNRTLFAARDRFGIKPLFYAWHDDTLYLASEVKALFAAGVPARWDAESVYHCRRIRRPSDAHAVRRRVPGAARPLPARHRQACRR